MSRLNRSLFGRIGGIVDKAEEDAIASRQRENMMAATTMRTLGMRGVDNSMPEPVGPQTMALGDAVAESLRYALEMSSRLESPEEGAVRPDDQLRKDYLTFLGYLHNPSQADPVQQVAMVNGMLRLNLTTQMFFQMRNENSMDPEFPNRVPESVKYYVKDEQSGGSGPINSGLSMSRFLVNTFRELGHCYISFGGVSPDEIRRLTEYIIMLNNYLRENRLFHTMDPYRKGETGSPYFGLPVRQEADDFENPLSGGINMPGSSGINMPGSGGINMPGSSSDLSKGIDFPSGGSDLSKGIDFPGSSSDKPKTSENVRQGLGTSDDFQVGERESLLGGGGSDDGMTLGNRDALDSRGSFSLADRDGSGLGGGSSSGLGDEGGLNLGARDDFYL